ncbi:Uncharacterized membrane protein [Clostridium cavendishii DSM 21758]|uniref:Uncharacterized membrane protein n=1 Tax=Clostridium cavendishii DSM 21758 TaxID=1121302 RepID=A0A1M6FH34_9CLOT|nr:putative ABC transporter permease [Clostridium cavendishii]SHI96977.1 Uncharacterized membrane protein [Clostridium cavendishii DSM 21758]
MFRFTILGIPFYMIIFFFFIYSFLGWIAEICYAYHNRKVFVNRGFLFGPICPIYGGSLVCIIVLTNSVKDNIFLLFLFATIITSFLEYVTGFFLEKVFKSKWWDYTEDPFNLHGRICLHFSIMWGIATTILIKIIHPIINYAISLLSIETSNIILVIILSILMIDLIFTLKSLIKLKPIIIELSKITNELKNRYATLLAITKEKTIDKLDFPTVGVKDLVIKYNNYYNNLNFNHKRLLQAFPSLSTLILDKIVRQMKDKFIQIRDSMRLELLKNKDDVIDEISDIIKLDERK